MRLEADGYRRTGVVEGNRITSAAAAHEAAQREHAADAVHGSADSLPQRQGAAGLGRALLAVERRDVAAHARDQAARSARRLQAFTRKPHQPRVLIVLIVEESAVGRLVLG